MDKLAMRNVPKALILLFLTLVCAPAILAVPAASPQGSEPHKLRQATRVQVARSLQHQSHPLNDKRQAVGSSVPSSCGVASAFQLAVINQDGSVSGNYASVIEPLETNFYRYMSWTSNATAAEVFRFDSQCRLVDSQGYKADAVWTTSALQSPIWLDSEELHIDYNGVYGDCKSQDGMLVCSFAPAGEMSLCDYGDVRPHHLAGARSDLTSKSPGFDGCN
ncbi:hypothetical protein EMMF5_004319 [Cystobasidiomycetes sp. EMM_F5]